MKHFIEGIYFLMEGARGSTNVIEKWGKKVLAFFGFKRVQESLNF